MHEKGVNFRSKQTGIEEFYPVARLKSMTFSNIAEDLYGRLLHENATIPKLLKTRDNIIPQEHRTGLIKFFYLKESMEVPIPKSRSVIEFYFQTGVSEVLFFVDVIGGAVDASSAQHAEELSHFQFLSHAREILSDPKLYGKWLLKEHGENRFRIMKTVMNHSRQTITIVIQPNTGYPKRPPRVVTIPRHPDPCFRQDGQLDWTIVRSDDKFTWELYKDGNPLVYLLDELKTKYGLVF